MTITRHDKRGGVTIGADYERFAAAYGALEAVEVIADLYGGAGNVQVRVSGVDGFGGFHIWDDAQTPRANETTEERLERARAMVAPLEFTRIHGEAVSPMFERVTFEDYRTAVERLVVGPIESDGWRREDYNIGAIADAVLLKDANGWGYHPRVRDADFWNVVDGHEYTEEAHERLLEWADGMALDREHRADAATFEFTGRMLQVFRHGKQMGAAYFNDPAEAAAEFACVAGMVRELDGVNVVLEDLHDGKLVDIAYCGRERA